MCYTQEMITKFNMRLFDHLAKFMRLLQVLLVNLTCERIICLLFSEVAYIRISCKTVVLPSLPNVK